jgi:hypothetical protein
MGVEVLNSQGGTTELIQIKPSSEEVLVLRSLTSFILSFVLMLPPFSLRYSSEFPLGRHWRNLATKWIWKWALQGIRMPHTVQIWPYHPQIRSKVRCLDGLKTPRSPPRVQLSEIVQDSDCLLGIWSHTRLIGPIRPSSVNILTATWIPNMSTRLCISRLNHRPALPSIDPGIRPRKVLCNR